MRYRPDIDGLRAIAVLAVVLYHAAPGLLPGGYTGVDVFFVISGFLITRLIDAEMREGRFSFAQFWLRRVRRLVPALLVVCAVSAAFAWALLLPAGFRDFGQSLVAAALFLSNLLFWTESGYFDAAATTKPLLHTWSLAIEEQFYLIFPAIFVLLMRRSRRAVVVGLCVLWALSFWAAWRTSITDPSLAFYAPHTRMWELLTGALLALAMPHLALSRRAAEVAGLLGLAALAATFAGLSPTPLFPGPGALLPCLGAALLIASAGRGTRLGRALSSPGPVGIGLISYSLYLWHWPALVFAGIYANRSLTAAETAGVLAAALVASALSWRFVEQPVRRGNALASSRHLLAVAGTGAAAALALGLFAHGSGGIPGRWSPATLRIAEGDGLLHDRRDCHFAEEKATTDELCRRGAGGPPQVLLLGDSHADMYAPVLFPLLKERGLAGIQLTDSQYLPVPGWERAGLAGRYAGNGRLIEAILAREPTLRTVFLGQYWTQALDYPLRPGSGPYRDGPAAVEAALGDLVRRYPDHRFILIGPVPEGPNLGPEAAARAAASGRDVPETGRAATERHARRAIAMLERLARRHPNVELLPLIPALCGRETCAAASAEGLLYRDNDHLSVHGAALAEASLHDALHDAAQVRAEAASGPGPIRAREAR